jgi:hypothetical protein
MIVQSPLVVIHVFGVLLEHKELPADLSRLYVAQVSFCPPSENPLLNSVSGWAVKHSALLGLRAPATPPMEYSSSVCRYPEILCHVVIHSILRPQVGLQ